MKENMSLRRKKTPNVDCLRYNQIDALNRSNKRVRSIHAHLILGYHIIWVPCRQQSPPRCGFLRTKPSKNQPEINQDQQTHTIFIAKLLCVELVLNSVTYSLRYSLTHLLNSSLGLPKISELYLCTEFLQIYILNISLIYSFTFKLVFLYRRMIAYVLFIFWWFPFFWLSFLFVNSFALLWTVCPHQCLANLSIYSILD